MTEKPSYEDLEKRIQELEQAEFEHRQVEEKLRANELNLAKAQQIAHIGNWNWNLLSDSVSWSDELYCIMGLSPQEFGASYEAYLEYIHPDDLVFFKKLTAKALKEKKPYSTEYRIVRPNKDIRILYEQGEVILDSNNIPINLFGIVQDITHRKQAETELLTNEEKYRTMMEAMKDLVYICSPDFRIEYANPAMIKKIGRNAIGEYCFRALHNLNEKCPWCVHDEVQKNRRMETEITSPIDDRPYHNIHLPLIKKNGSISKMTVFRDISEIKKVQKALKESSIIINRSPAVAFLLKNTKNWPVEFVSENAINVFGYSSKDFISGNISYYSIIHPDDVKKVIKETSILVDNKRDKNDFVFQPHRIINKNGEIKWLDNRVFIRKDEKGNTTHLEGLVIDITDQKRVEEEKKELESQLLQAQKLEAIGVLAGGIAHDFNNILFPIIGLTEMLLETDIPREIKPDLQVILKAGNRAKDLVAQILTFSRKHHSEMEPIEVTYIVKESIKFARSTLPSNIKIKQKIDNNCGHVLADAIHLHQVVMNLITNAFHAMENSGGVLSISLQQKRMEPQNYSPEKSNSSICICLTIEDTGMGMDSKTLEKIFQPYFSTKEQNKGTGLGLAVTHGIVKGMGGEIIVKSELGKGSCFNVFLPTIDTEIKDIVPSEQKKINGNNEKILIVDDEESITILLKTMLTNSGFIVDTFTDSLAALKAFQKSPKRYDLIISDLTMPEMNGDQFCREILQINSKIPKILITGFNENIVSEEKSKFGIDKVLTKPVSKVKLLTTIHKLLQ